MAGEEDLVAFHVPYVDVGKGYVGFFQGGHPDLCRCSGAGCPG